MSSTSSFPSFKWNKTLIISKISILDKNLFSISVFILSLEFIFTLPTDERSYLLLEKNKFLNSSSAVSKVGGSPGLNILYISKSASSLDLALSITRVFLIYGPTSRLSICKIEICLILFFSKYSKCSWVISAPASMKILPFFSSIISSEINMPIIDSSDKETSLYFFSKSLISRSVIFELLFINSLPVLLFKIEYGSILPL